MIPTSCAPATRAQLETGGDFSLSLSSLTATRLHNSLVDDLRTLVGLGDLEIEDYAIINSKYLRLVAAGWEFPVEFQLLMKLLDRQARHSDDDPDSDRCVDDGQHEDDVDEVPMGETRAA